MVLSAALITKTENKCSGTVRLNYSFNLIQQAEKYKIGNDGQLVDSDELSKSENSQNDVNFSR